MKKIIIIAIVSLSSTIAFAQNVQNNDKYSYNKEGLDQQNIQIRENYIKQAKIEEQKQAEISNTQVTPVTTTIVSDPTDGVKATPAATSKQASDPKNNPSVAKPTAQPANGSQIKKEEKVQQTNTSSTGFTNTK